MEKSGLSCRITMGRRISFTTPFDWCATRLTSNMQALTHLLWTGGLSGERIAEVIVSDEVKAALTEAYSEASWPFALPSDVVFPPSLWPSQLRVSDGSPMRMRILDDEALATLRQAFCGEWMLLPEDAPGHQLAKSLLREGVLSIREGRPLNAPFPGIYRLQHASVLIVGEAGRVLVDPVIDMDAAGWPDPMDLGPIDAILISHGHGDHFSLGTLMRFPRNTPIIVPRVARGSMLSPPMAGYLRAAGFTNVQDPPWGEKLSFKDVDVHIAPFLGEQPWVTFSSPDPDLRNHGNTYVVEACGRKAWTLVDAGFEHDGSMVDVAVSLRDKIGPIDIVLSNLRSFVWHPLQIDFSGRYLMCFPKAALGNPEQLPLHSPITLGPVGVAQVMAACGANLFLPYAHWFQQPGELVQACADQSESELVAEVAEALWRRGTKSAACLDWRVADGFAFAALNHSSPQITSGALTTNGHAALV